MGADCGPGQLGVGFHTGKGRVAEIKLSPTPHHLTCHIPLCNPGYHPNIE
jgi:hypothetical protein